MAAIEISSEAWSLARERLQRRAGGHDQAGLLWCALERPMRTDVLARWVHDELTLGTPVPLVRAVLAEHGAFGPHTIRYSVAAKLTRQANVEALDERLGATKEAPVDRGDFDNIARLIDTDPHAALAWLKRGDARITPHQRDVLIEDAEVMLRIRAAR